MVIHVVNLTLASENAKRMERQIISPSLFLIRKTGVYSSQLCQTFWTSSLSSNMSSIFWRKKLQFQHICQRHIPLLCRCMSQ